MLTKDYYHQTQTKMWMNKLESDVEQIPKMKVFANERKQI